MTLHLESQAFQDNASIPTVHTCDGESRSVPLSWTGAPDGTKSFAVICDDPDAPSGTFSHWAICDIPADRDALPEGLAKDAEIDGMRQAVNDFGEHGYGPPCPPKRHGMHRYIFRLYALDTQTLDLPSDAMVPDVERAAQPHTLATARLTGTYAR